jgi:addiction module RelE/StbE family toxin
MRIDYLPSFKKKFRRLHPKIQILAESRRKLFKEYPYHMGLKTHKLQGDLEGKWAFSINQKYRIVFRFIDEQNVLFLDIGTHDIYD